MPRDVSNAPTDTPEATSDPLAVLIDRAQNDQEYREKTLATLKDDAQPSGLSAELLRRLTTALEKMSPVTPRYVGVDGKTEVDPETLPPGTVYYTGDMRQPFKKPWSKDAMVALYGERPFTRTTEAIPGHVVFMGLDFYLPMDEEVTLPNNVVDYLHERTRYIRDVESGAEIKRLKPGLVIQAGALRPLRGFEDTTAAQETKAS